MHDDLSRVDLILSVLIEENESEGREIITFEGETYARIVVRGPDRPVLIMEENLHTLARQIDRRLK